MLVKRGAAVATSLGGVRIATLSSKPHGQDLRVPIGVEAGGVDQVRFEVDRVRGYVRADDGEGGYTVGVGESADGCLAGLPAVDDGFSVYET